MHITLAGKLGSGKSTIASLLAERHGFEIYSTGKIQRELARSFGVSTLEMNQMMSSDTKYDHMIDDEVTRISIERAKDKLLFDSRMAWHFAKNSFRVFFTIDPQIAAVRVMANPRGAEETYTDVDDACEKLILRSVVENQRFKEIYGTDNLDYSNYDLIVDTSYEIPDNICKLVAHEYEEYCKDPSAYKRKMYFSPKSLYPTVSAEEINSIRFYGVSDKLATDKEYVFDPIFVTCIDHYNYIVDGHKRALASLMMRIPYVRAEYASDVDTNVLKDKIKKAGPGSVTEYGKIGGFAHPTCPKLYN